MQLWICLLDTSDSKEIGLLLETSEELQDLKIGVISFIHLVLYGFKGD